MVTIFIHELTEKQHLWVIDLRAIYEKSSNEDRTSQKEPAKTLQAESHIDDILCGIFLILSHYLPSRETLSPMEKYEMIAIRRASSIKMVLIVSHELFCQYEAMQMSYHIQYGDGDDYLEKSFVYINDSKIP